MASISTLATDNLNLRGAGTNYNVLTRFFTTKAEAVTALGNGDWVPVAGKTNCCITADEGLLVYDTNTQTVVAADGAGKAYVDTSIANLIDAAPGTLDTLNELAAAIADDADFFTTMATANAAIQADVDANEAASLAARNTIQADVDANEADCDAGIAAETAARVAAVAAVQADVDANEADADTAIAAVQADVDANESDADTAIAAVQADVDTNEADADAAIAAENAAMLAAVAAVQSDVNTNEADADAAIAAVQADVDNNEADADTALALKAPLASPALTGTPTAPTAGAGTNTTQIATSAFVTTAIANLVDGAPGAIDTLNELAAALGDDANFSTTITNSIAAVQTDVNTNEADADAAIAAVQADVDANEIAAAALVTAENTAMLAAVAVVQADVNTNESDADTAIAAVQADVDANEADADAAIAAVQADVDANEAAAAALVAANEVHIDNKATLLGLAKDSTHMGTFTGSTITDNQTVKAAIQLLETALELRATIDDPTFTTKVASPEFHSAGSHLKFKADTNDIIFYPNNTETLQITRHSSTGHPTFTANGGTGEFKFNQATDLAAGLKVSGGLTDAANDGAAASAGVAVGSFYRNGSVVMIRVS